MAIVFMDSFDFYSAASDTANRGWTVDSGTPTIETTTVKDGRACISVDGNERLTWALPSADSGIVFFGFWFRFNYDPGTEQYMLRIGNSTTGDNTRLALGTDKKIRIYNATLTQLGSASTNALAKDTWYFIVFKIRHANSISTNDVILYVNDVAEITLSATTDTAFISEDVTSITFQGSSSGGDNHYFDSLVVWDDSGSAPWNAYVNTFRMQSLKPNGNGTTNNFVGQDADSTDNYLNADETTPDGDTSYNDSTATGDIDLYAFENMSGAINAVLAVNSVAVWKKTSSDSKTARQVTRISSTNYEGSNKSPTTSYTWDSRIMETSPATSSAWTKTEVDGAQFGVKDQA